MTAMECFPAARYRFEFTVQTPLHLPVYAGSALRGAFGHALKRTVCVTRETECKTCALYRSCTGPAIFAPPPPLQAHAPQRFTEVSPPYVIEPPAWGARRYDPGDALSFGMVLIGSALQHLPLIVHVWQRAFDRGVGAGDGRAVLNAVYRETDSARVPIFGPESSSIPPQNAVRLPMPPAPPPAQVSLHLLTPLRLQREGRALPAAELTPDRLLMGLVRRTALLSSLHAERELSLDFGGLAAQAKMVRGEKQLQWRDWGRFSNRQKQEMKLGGVVGTWRLFGNLVPFWPFLYWGQWLHVGKETSFGLGGYILE